MKFSAPVGAHHDALQRSAARTIGSSNKACRSEEMCMRPDSTTSRLGFARLCAGAMLACLLLLAGGALSGCGEDKKEAAAGVAAQQRPAPQVTAMTVEPRAIPFTPSFVAQTESSQQVNIVARVSGFLDKIAYQEGEMVREGQLLFQLDPKPFQAQVEAARGAVLSQQARLTTAQANLGRVKPLAQENALSQADLDRAQGEFDAAKAALFTAQAQLTEAQLNLGYTTIRSPVNGLASRSQQRQGAYINAMSSDANLTYVAAVHPIWVNFSVSQNQTAKWRQESQAKRLIPPANEVYEIDVVLSDGTLYPYRGRINFADPSFSQDTGSFLVRAVLPNPRLELRPGMFVTAYVRGAVRPNAIVVPQLAVQQGPKGHFVYVIKADDTAEVRPVIVGDYQGEKDIVINSGLNAGDRVVVDGVLKVVPGLPVKATAVKAPVALPPDMLAPGGAGAAAPGATGAASDTGGVPAPGSPAPDGTARSPAAVTHSPSAAPGPGGGGTDLSARPPRPAAPKGTPSASSALQAGATAGPPIPAGTYGPVRDGETLIEISIRARPQGVTFDQTLVGIFRANPEAFTPDHHRLRSGVTLAIPSQTDLAAIDPRSAADEVRAAREKWAAEHGGK
jgi:membrane fusion protein (multidrug efflux system)